jgi:type I restriction enzyme, S subunit
VEIDRGFGCEECRYFIGDWRNVMKGSWKIKTLAEVCILKSGTTVEKSLEKDFGDVPYLKVADMNLPENDTEIVTSSRFLEEKSLKKNSVFPVGTTIFPKRGGAIMTNKKRLTSVPICTDLNIMGVIPSNVLLPRFLYYYFLNIDMKKLGSGSSIPQINNYDIEPLLISFPLIPDQKRIVSIVDEAFESIDIAIENTKKNLTNARELFESYLNAIFIHKDDDWEEKTLEDICSITSKLVDPRQPEFIDLPHIGAGNMVYLTGELIDIKTAREEELISGKFLFDEKMVLYSKIRPYLMKACRPEFKGLCSADVYPLIPNNEQLDRDFLFHILMSRNFTNYAIAGSDRAGMPKVNRDHLFRYSVWIPNISEQIRLAKEIDAIAVETQRLETIYQEKLAALTELKQSILQKAFTGELTADSASQTTKKAKEVIAA